MAISEQEKQIMAYGTANGKTYEQIRQAIIRSRTGYVPPTQQEQAQQAQEPSMLTRMGNDIQQAGSNVADAIQGEGQFKGQSDIQRGVQATAQAFNAIPKVASEVLPKPVRSVLGTVGDMAAKGYQALTNFMSELPSIKEYAKQYPERNFVDEILGTLSGGGQIANDILAVGQGTKAAQFATDNTIQGAKATVNGVTDLAKITGTGVKNMADDFASPVMKRISTNLAESKAQATAQAALPKNVQTATKMGLSSEEAQLVGTANKPTANVMKQMLTKDTKGTTIERPNVEIGKVVVEQYKNLENVRKQVGVSISEEAKKILGTEPIGTMGMRSQLADNLKAGGIEIRGNTLDFTQSSLTTAQQSVVKELFDTVTNLPLKTNASTLLNISDRLRALKRELIANGQSVPRIRTATGESIDIFNATAENVFSEVAQKSPALRGLYLDYAKLSQLSDDVGSQILKIGKETVNNKGANAFSAAQAGVRLRGLLSNSNSATDMLNTLAQLEALSPSGVNLTGLVKFSNLLEDISGAAGGTFKGGIESGVRRGLTAPASGAVEMVLNKGAEYVSKTVGTSAATKLKAIEDLLNSLE